MAPLYPLEDNINKTEECRKDIINSINNINMFLEIFKKTNPHFNDLTTKFNSIKNINNNTPLNDISTILSNINYNIENNSSPIYLYYTYCGYSMLNNVVEPILAYTSNSQFRKRLQIDDWFYRFINGKVENYNIKNDLGRGRVIYRTSTDNAGGLTQSPTSPGSAGYYDLLYRNDPNGNYRTNTGYMPLGKNELMANSFTPSNAWDQGKYAYYADGRDFIMRFPWYPCKILYPKNQDYGRIYNGQAVPVKQLTIRNNSSTYDIIANLTKIESALIDSGQWGGNYITADRNSSSKATDVIVACALPAGSFNIDTTLTYNNTSLYSISNKRINFSNPDNNLIFCDDIVTDSCNIPTIAAPGINNNIKQTLYFRSSYADDERCMFTPLARRQPVIIIDDVNILKSLYNYTLTENNRASSTKIAVKLNDIDLGNTPLNYVYFINAKDSYNSNNGTANLIVKEFTLDKGTYSLVMMGGGSSGAANKFSGNDNRAMSGANGAGITATFTLHKKSKFKIQVGGPSNYNNPEGTIQSYAGTGKVGGNTILSILVNNTYKVLYTANGGGAAKLSDGDKGKASGGKATKSYDNSLNNIITIKSESLDDGSDGGYSQAWSNYTTSYPSGNSVFYNDTLILPDDSIYTIYNNNGYGAVRSHGTTYSAATGGLFHVKRLY